MSSSSSSSSLDPFDTAKEEVVQKLNVVTALYELFHEQKQDGTGDRALSDLIKELKKNCKSVEFYLKDLEGTVKIVEKQPARFGISQKELQNRKQFIQQTKNQVSAIKKEVELASSRKSRKEDRKNLLQNDQFEDPIQTAYNRQIERTNQDFINNQMLQQEEIKREQDKGIDQALEATNRIYAIASELGEELESQNKELEEFEHEVDQTSNLLKRTAHKMEKLMSVGGDVGKIICIIVLVVIIALMVVLLFGI